MKLQKRDCPVIIRVLPRGAGWTDIEWFVPAEMEKPLVLTASYIGGLFGDFIRALYCLSPSQRGYTRGYHITDFLPFEYDTSTQRLGQIYVKGESSPNLTYMEIPHKTRFHWEEEPGGSDWVLARVFDGDTASEDNVFLVQVDISLNRYPNEGHRKFEYSFTVEYRELCYAVAKAMTDVMKEYGFSGYSESTSDEVINVNELLFLKAIALDCMEARELFYFDNDSWKTDFDKEHQLLIFDM